MSSKETTVAIRIWEGFFGISKLLWNIVLGITNPFLRFYNSILTGHWTGTRYKHRRLLCWLEEMSKREVHNLNSIWIDGSILCDAIHSVVPGVCDELRDHKGNPLRHAQDLATHVLHLPPGFSITELHKELSPTLEKRFWRYLLTFKHALLLRAARNSVEEEHIPEFLIADEYVARGMGLITASINERAIFFIYTKDDSSLVDITVEIRGPNGDYGIVTSGEDSDSESHSIPVDYRLTPNCLKVCYLPRSLGLHELYLTKYGFHIPGSPFPVNVEESSGIALARYSYKQWFSEEEKERKKKEEEEKKKMQVVSRIIDFVSEKMYLTDDGKLIRIEENVRPSSPSPIFNRRGRSGRSVSPRPRQKKSNQIRSKSLTNQKLIQAAECIQTQYNDEKKKSYQNVETQVNENLQLLVFQERCQKIVNTCDFLLNHTSKQKCLEIVKTAENILGIPCEKFTIDSTNKIISNKPVGLNRQLHNDIIVQTECTVTQDEEEDDDQNGEENQNKLNLLSSKAIKCKTPEINITQVDSEDDLHTNEDINFISYANSEINKTFNLNKQETSYSSPLLQRITNEKIHQKNATSKFCLFHDIYANKNEFNDNSFNLETNVITDHNDEKSLTLTSMCIKNEEFNDSSSQHNAEYARKSFKIEGNSKLSNSSFAIMHSNSTDTETITNTKIKEIKNNHIINKIKLEIPNDNQNNGNDNYPEKQLDIEIQNITNKIISNKETDDKEEITYKQVRELNKQYSLQSRRSPLRKGAICKLIEKFENPTKNYIVSTTDQLRQTKQEKIQDSANNKDEITIDKNNTFRPITEKDNAEENKHVATTIKNYENTLLSRDLTNYNECRREGSENQIDNKLDNQNDILKKDILMYEASVEKSTQNEISNTTSEEAEETIISNKTLQSNKENDKKCKTSESSILTLIQDELMSEDKIKMEKFSEHKKIDEELPKTEENVKSNAKEIVADDTISKKNKELSDNNQANISEFNNILTDVKQPQPTEESSDPFLKIINSQQLNNKDELEKENKVSALKVFSVEMNTIKQEVEQEQPAEENYHKSWETQEKTEKLVVTIKSDIEIKLQEQNKTENRVNLIQKISKSTNNKETIFTEPEELQEKLIKRIDLTEYKDKNYEHKSQNSEMKNRSSPSVIDASIINNEIKLDEIKSDKGEQANSKELSIDKVIKANEISLPIIKETEISHESVSTTDSSSTSQFKKNDQLLPESNFSQHLLDKQTNGTVDILESALLKIDELGTEILQTFSIQKEAKIKVEKIIQDQTKEPKEEIINQEKLLEHFQEECYINAPREVESCSKMLQQPHTQTELVQTEFQIEESHKPEACMEQSELKLQKEEIEHFHMRTEKNINVSKTTAESINQEIKNVEPQTKQDEIKEQKILQGNEKIKIYETIKPKESQNLNEQKDDIKPIDSHSLMIEAETDKYEQTQERELQVNLSEVKKSNQEDESQLNNAEQSSLFETKTKRLTTIECIQDELHSTLKEVSDDEQANQNLDSGIIKAKENVPDKLCKIKQEIDDQEMDSVLLQTMTKAHYKNKTEEKIMFECSNVKDNTEKTKLKESELKVPELNLTVNVTVISDTKKDILNLEETKKDYKQNKMYGSKLIDIKVAQEDVHTKKHKEESLNTYEIIQEQSYIINKINSEISELPKGDIQNQQEVTETNMESEFLDVNTIKIEDLHAEVPGLERLDTQSIKMDMVKFNNQIIEENLKNTVELDLQQEEHSKMSTICQASDSEIINKYKDKTKTLQDQELLTKLLSTQDSCLEHSETVNISSVNQEISKEIEKITLQSTKTEFIDQYKKINVDIKQIQEININAISTEYNKENKELIEISPQSNQEELLGNFEEKALIEECKDVNKKLIQPSFKIEITDQRTQGHKSTEISETNDKTEELKKKEEIIDFKSVTDSLNEKTVDYNLLNSVVENKQGESEDLRLLTKKEDKLRANENKIMNLGLTQTYESEHFKDFDEKIENPEEQTMESTSITLHFTEINISTNITEELTGEEIQTNEVTKSQEYEIIQPISTTECPAEKSEPETEIKSLINTTKEFSITETINEESILKSTSNNIDKNEMEFDVKTQCNIDLTEIIQVKEMNSMINKQEEFVCKLKSTENSLIKEDETLQKEEILLISISESNVKEEKEMEIKLLENKESMLSSTSKPETESLQLEMAEFISVASTEEQKEKLYQKETYPSENKEEESATEPKTLLENEKEINITETAVNKHTDKLDKLQTSKTHVKQKTSDRDVLQAKSIEPLPADFIAKLDEKTHNKDVSLIEENEQKITLIDNRDHITVIQNDKEKYLIISQEEIESNKETDKENSLLILSEHIEENKITRKYKKTLNEDNRHNINEHDLKPDATEDKKCNSLTTESFKDQVVENSSQPEHFIEDEKETMKMEIINLANKLEQLNLLKLEPENNISKEKIDQSDNEITENIPEYKEVIEKVVAIPLSNKLDVNEINKKFDPFKKIKHVGDKEESITMMNYITQQGKEPQILETTKTNYEKLDKIVLTNEIIDHTSTIENTIEDHKERVPTEQEPIIDNLEELTTQEDLTNKMEMHTAMTGNLEKCTGIAEQTYSEPNKGINSDRILADLQEAKEALSTVKLTNENMREEMLLEEASTTKMQKELNMIDDDDERNISAVAAKIEDIENVEPVLMVSCSNERTNHVELKENSPAPAIDKKDVLCTVEEQIRKHSAIDESEQLSESNMENEIVKWTIENKEMVQPVEDSISVFKQQDSINNLDLNNENISNTVMKELSEKNVEMCLSTEVNLKQVSCFDDAESTKESSVRENEVISLSDCDIEKMKEVVLIGKTNSVKDLDESGTVERENMQENLSKKYKELNKQLKLTNSKTECTDMVKEIPHHRSILHDMFEETENCSPVCETVLPRDEGHEIPHDEGQEISITNYIITKNEEVRNESKDSTKPAGTLEKENNEGLYTTLKVTLRTSEKHEEEIDILETILSINAEKELSIVDKENQESILEKQTKDFQVKELKSVSETENHEEENTSTEERYFTTTAENAVMQNKDHFIEQCEDNDLYVNIQETSTLAENEVDEHNQTIIKTEELKSIDEINIQIQTKEKAEDIKISLATLEKETNRTEQELTESIFIKECPEKDNAEIKSNIWIEKKEPCITYLEDKEDNSITENEDSTNRDFQSSSIAKIHEGNERQIDNAEITSTEICMSKEISLLVIKNKEYTSETQTEKEERLANKIGISGKTDVKTVLLDTKAKQEKQDEICGNALMKDFIECQTEAEGDVTVFIETAEYSSKNKTKSVFTRESIVETNSMTLDEKQELNNPEAVNKGCTLECKTVGDDETTISVKTIGCKYSSEQESVSTLESTAVSGIVIEISDRIDKLKEICDNEITIPIKMNDSSERAIELITTSECTRESDNKKHDDTGADKQHENCEANIVKKENFQEVKTDVEEITAVIVKTTEYKYSSEQSSESTPEFTEVIDIEIDTGNRVDKQDEISISIKTGECKESSEKATELISIPECTRERDNKHDGIKVDKQLEISEAIIKNKEHVPQSTTDAEERTTIFTQKTESKDSSENEPVDNLENIEERDIMRDSSNKVNKHKEICDIEIAVPYKIDENKDSPESTMESLSIIECTRESLTIDAGTETDKQKESFDTEIVNVKHTFDINTDVGETAPVLPVASECKDLSGKAIELVSTQECFGESNIIDAGIIVYKQEEINNEEFSNNEDFLKYTTDVKETTTIQIERSECKVLFGTESIPTPKSNVEWKDSSENATESLSTPESNSKNDTPDFGTRGDKTEICVPQIANKEHTEEFNTDVKEETTIPVSTTEWEDLAEKAVESESTITSYMTDSGTGADKHNEISISEIVSKEHILKFKADVEERTSMQVETTNWKNLSNKTIELGFTPECITISEVIDETIKGEKQEEICEAEIANKQHISEFKTGVEKEILEVVEPTETTDLLVKFTQSIETAFTTDYKQEHKLDSDYVEASSKIRIEEIPFGVPESTKDDMQEDLEINSVTKCNHEISKEENLIKNVTKTGISVTEDKQNDSEKSTKDLIEDINQIPSITECKGTIYKETNLMDLSQQMDTFKIKCIDDTTLQATEDLPIKITSISQLNEKNTEHKQSSELQKNTGIQNNMSNQIIMENIDQTLKRETDESQSVLSPGVVGINEEHNDGPQSTNTRPLSKPVEHSTIQINDCNSIEKTEKFKENIAEDTCITDYTNKHEKEIDGKEITVCMIENKHLEIEDRKNTTTITTEIKPIESGLLKDKNLLSNETDNEYSDDKLKPLGGVDMQCDTDTQLIKQEAEIMQQEYPSEILAQTVEIKTERFNIENLSLPQSKSEENKKVELSEMQNEIVNLCEISKLEKDALEENKIKDLKENDSLKKLTENLEVKETKEYLIMNSTELLSEKVEIRETNSTRITSEEFDNKVIKNIELNKTTEDLFKPHAETLVTEESILNLTETTTAQSINTTESDQKIETETTEPIIAHNAAELVKNPCTSIYIMTESKEESQKKGHNKMVYTEEISTNKMDSKIINNINKSENSNNQAFEQNTLTDMEHEKERSYLNEMEYSSKNYLQHTDDVKEIKSSSNEAVNGYYTEGIKLKEANTNLNVLEQPGTDVINEKGVNKLETNINIDKIETTKPVTEKEDLKEQTIFTTQIINETHSDNLYLDTNEQIEPTEILTKPQKIVEVIEGAEIENTTNKSGLNSELLGYTRSTIMVRETDEEEATVFIENKSEKSIFIDKHDEKFQTKCDTKLDQLAELTEGTKTKQILSTQTDKLYTEEVRVKDEIIKMNVEANNEEMKNRETLAMAQEMEKLQSEKSVTKKFKENEVIYNELIVSTNLKTEIDKESNKVEELLLSNEKAGQELFKRNDHQELHTAENELRKCTFKSEQLPETNLAIPTISQELHEKLPSDTESSKINNIPEQDGFEIREINDETQTLIEEKTVQKSKSIEFDGFINEDLTDEIIQYSLETDTLILNETQNSNKEQILTTIKKQLTENTEGPRIVNYIENSEEKLSKEYVTENSNIEIEKLDNFPKISMEDVNETSVSVFEKIQVIDKSSEVSDEVTDTEEINCKKSIIEIENKEEKKEMCLKNKSTDVLTQDKDKAMNTMSVMESTQSFIYEHTAEDTKQLNVGMEVKNELISIKDYKELNEEKAVEQSESLNAETDKSLLSSVTDISKLSETVLKIEDDNTEQKEYHNTLTERKLLKTDQNNLEKSATDHLQTDIFKTEISFERSTELHNQDYLIIDDTKLHELSIDTETELDEIESHERSMIEKGNLKEDVLNKVTDKVSSPTENQQFKKQEININNVNNIPEVITNAKEIKDNTNKLIESSVTETETRIENGINISTMTTKIKNPRPIKKLINFFELKPEEQKSTFNSETTPLPPQNKNNDKINNITTKRKYFENYTEVSNETSQSRNNVEEIETINKINANNKKIENKAKEKNISLLEEEVENDIGEDVFHLCKYDSNMNDSLITNSYTNISCEFTQSNVSDESFGSNEHLLLCIENVKENDQEEISYNDNDKEEILTQINKNQLEKIMFVEDEISNNKSIADNIQTDKTEAQHKSNNQIEILHQLEYNDSKLNDITFNENEHEVFIKSYELKEIVDFESDIKCISEDKTEIKSIHASKDEKDEISKSNINLSENIIKSETENFKEIQILDAILSENECYEKSEQLEDLNENTIKMEIYTQPFRENKTNVIKIDNISTDDLSQPNLLEIDFNNEYTDHNKLITNQNEEINILLLDTNSSSVCTDKTHFSANINNENLFNDIVNEGYLMMIKSDFNDKNSEEESFEDKISISNNVSEIELSSDDKNNIINETDTDKSNNDDENEILFGMDENSKELITNEITSKITDENIEISEISNQLIINKNFNYNLSSEIVAEKQIDEISNDISNYLDNVQNFIQSSEMNNDENKEIINKGNEELDSDNSSFNIQEKLHEALFSGDFEKYDIKTDESEGNEESYKEIADNILDNKEHGDYDNSLIIQQEKYQDFEKYDVKTDESEGNEESYKEIADNILDNKVHGNSDNSLIVKQEKYQEELFPNDFEKYDTIPDESDGSNKENYKETADNALHYIEHGESSEDNDKGYKEIVDNVSVTENYQNDLIATDEIHDELEVFKRITADRKRNDSLLVQLSTDSDIYLYNNNIRNSELDESFGVIPDCLCESLLSNNEMIENVEEPKGDSFEDNFSQLLSEGGESTVDVNVGFEDNFIDKFTMMNNKDINDIDLDDTSNKFHLWSSNIEFGPPSNENILTNEITSEMDFDSIISAPSLNDALEKLEKRIQDKIKKKESINKNTNVFNEEGTKIQTDYYVNSKMNENELSQPDIQTAKQDKDTMQESNKEDKLNKDEINSQTNIPQIEMVNADNVNAQIKYENEQYPSISYSSCSRGSSRMEMIEEENEDELFTLFHNINSLNYDEIKLNHFDNLAGLDKNKNISESEIEDDNRTILNEQKFSEISFVITDTNTTDYLTNTSTSDCAIEIPEEAKCDKEEENTIIKITYEENYLDDDGSIKQENEVTKNIKDKENISSKNNYSNDENSGADTKDSSFLVITSSDFDNFKDEINSEKQNKIILDTNKQELEKDEIFKNSCEKEMKTDQQEVESETDKTKTKNSLVYNKKLYWDKKLELISKSTNNEAEKRLQQKTLQKHKAVDINNDTTQNTISKIKQIEQSNGEVQIKNDESITQQTIKANNKNDTQLKEVNKSETDKSDGKTDKSITENDETNQTKKTVDKWKDYWDNLLIEKEGQQIQQPIKKKTLEKQASIKVCGIVENNRNLFEVPKKYNDYRCTNNDNLNYTIVHNNINIETEQTEDGSFNETLSANNTISDNKLKNYDTTCISGNENDKKLSQNFENNNNKQPNKTDKNSLVLLKKERKVSKCIQMFELKANSLISNDSNLKQNSENTQLKCNILYNKNNECQSNKNTSLTTPTTIKVDYFDDTETDNECLNKNTKRIESIESSDGEFYNPLTMTPCGRIRSFSTGKIEEIPDSIPSNNEDFSPETNENNKQKEVVDKSSNNKLNNLKEPTTMIRAKSEGNLVSDEQVGIHQRFERAKNFFKELEQSSSCTNIDKISTMKISSSLPGSSYSKKQISVDSDSCGEYCKPKRKESKYRRRGRRRKDSMKVRSAPTSDSEIKIKCYEKEFGGSERRKSKKVSERFHIKDLFRDISSSTDGIFRGIPNRKAVLASLKSVEDLRSATLDEEEEKEKESNRSQSLSNIPSGYQEEYPYLPTTPPNRFRPRSQFEGSLITRKMLLQLDI
ncbi:uncharacterized protein LOC142330596 [Lycorma delicatula]|uniref:uncharacterized protein LOC142330596 n=1 Tax=Lycorma delicatula TaxID=130591 RepID=UPI003F50D7AD